MSKIDKVLEKAAPVAKEAAKETAKLTGKGLKLAGKGIKNTGSKAIDNYKDKKAEQIETRIKELSAEYPDGMILRPITVDGFTNRKKLISMGLEKYARDAGLFDVPGPSKLVKIIVNQDDEVLYKIHGNYDTDIKRYFVVLGSGINKVGSVNEHEKLLSRITDNREVHETIKCGSNKLVLYDDYSFDNSTMSVERLDSTFRESHFIVRGLSGTMVEIETVRGQELVAIADPSVIDECVMIYTAIDLIRRPRPISGDGC